MVIVACMALSGMIGNELVMPTCCAGKLLGGRRGARHGPARDCSCAAAVVLILMAGYAYGRIISGYLPLASIGLISFCAVANFAPGVVLGLYWKRAHRCGVVAGLAGGFIVWLYALLLPTLRQSAGGGGGAETTCRGRSPGSSGRPGLRRRHPGQRPFLVRLAAGAREARRRAGRRLCPRPRFRRGAEQPGARRRPMPPHDKLRELL